MQYPIILTCLIWVTYLLFLIVHLTTLDQPYGMDQWHFCQLVCSTESSGGSWYQTTAITKTSNTACFDSNFYSNKVVVGTSDQSKTRLIQPTIKIFGECTFWVMDQNLPKFHVSNTISSRISIGYIAVGDGCWRSNVLVTSLRFWWPKEKNRQRTNYQATNIWNQSPS